MKTKIIVIIFLTTIFSCKKEKLKPKNEIDFQVSILIPDTLRIGENYGKVFDYKEKQNGDDIHLLTVIIENEYGNNETRKDTFSDGTLEPYFKIIRRTKGKQLVKFSIEEKILRETEINDDSSNLLIDTNKYYYSREFLVLDEEFKSKTNEKLIQEVNLKYDN